ncbi:MAG: response regulator [Cyclobacteriaceae bacterium]
MPSKTKKILIVDDDEVNNLICTHIIREFDQTIEVVSLTRGSEAILFLQNSITENQATLPDVILLDINMPIMSGWDFIEECRKLDINLQQKMQLFMLTSSQFYQDEEIATRYSEVTGLFTKPLSFNILDKIESSHF